MPERAWSRIWAAALVLSGLTAPAYPASPAQTNEYAIKAAALCNIIAFTDWPATAFATPDAPLVVGVLGPGPVVLTFGEFLASETWHGRRVNFRPLTSPRDAQSCHVLFIGRNEISRWGAIKNQVSGHPILTVSDGENFARLGGTVQLAIDRNKLQLLVNLPAARASGLVISSKVLRLAKVIDENKP